MSWYLMVERLTNNVGQIISSSKRFDENLMMVTFNLKMTQLNKKSKKKIFIKK